jgi:hypothetical protein
VKKPKKKISRNERKETEETFFSSQELIEKQQQLSVLSAETLNTRATKKGKFRRRKNFFPFPNYPHYNSIFSFISFR